jgi:hypothetical protein
VILWPDHDHYQWINPDSYQEVGVFENLYAVFEDYLSRRE